MTLAPAREHTKKEIKLMNKETTAEQTAGNNSSKIIYRVHSSDTERKDELNPYVPGEEKRIRGMEWMECFESVNHALTRIHATMAYVNSNIDDISLHYQWDWIADARHMKICYKQKEQDASTLTTRYMTFTIKPQEVK